MSVNGDDAKRARKPKVALTMAQAIGDDIVSRGLTEGDQLPNEKIMAEQLGVGRTTLREALRILETQGVIRIKPGPGGGPTVRQPRPDDLIGAMTLLLQFLGASLDEVATAREAVEPAAAALAAERAGPDDLAALQRTVDRMTVALEDDEVFYRENDAFHSRLAEAAGNTVLLVITETLERMTASLDANITFPVRTRSRIAAAHQRIIDAIRDRDVEGAADEASEHMAEFRRYTRRKYPQLLDQPIRWQPHYAEPDGAGR